jgi:carboxyl-terminal processing protease
MKKFIVLLIFISILFISCKKEPSGPPIIDLQGRDYLYDLMNEWYLWYNLMPSVKKDDYTDPFKLLEAMKYKTLDKWSFVENYDEFKAAMEGTFVGHGFRIGLDENGIARIALIYANSPLYANGVRRGWIVKKINDTEIAPILSAGNSAAYTQLIGESKAGITNKFLFQKPDGTEVTISSTKASFTLNSVLVYDTLHLSSGTTGHLVFDSFIQPSTQELQTAFSYFKTNAVTDLVIDLRYNSGGILDVAVDLASLIAGNAFVSTTLIKSSYNDKHTSENRITNFKSEANPLNLTRLVVITTRYTASASEVVINGLKPHLNVKCIGDTTNGKPTGMNVWTYPANSNSPTFVFAPITFKLVNSANEGDFFGGILPAKYVPDDISHDFSDRKELCLKEAIHYLETGSVSTKSEYIYNHSVQVSEKPAWMNNLFISVK